MSEEDQRDNQKLGTDTYSVGYKRPPAQYRFQKGRSGNPSGRPRHRDKQVDASLRDTQALMLHEAYRLVSIREGDRIIAAPWFVGSTLAALKAFFLWLSGQPGFKSRLTYSDADYFNLSAKETAIAKAARETPVPTIEQIRRVLFAMPYKTDIEKRNRALFALMLLTGARVDAIASMRLKHVDLVAGKVDQDARQVRTKFSKTFPSYFYPVGEDVLAIFVDWVTFLQRERLWGLDDPLFPKTRVVHGPDRLFEANGLERKCWSNTAPIQTIFRSAFEAVGLPYYNPHSFRKTLALLGQRMCRTFEDEKAWSQNLGHDDINTTRVSYGKLPAARQGELIRDFWKPKASDGEAAEILKAIRQMTDRLPA